MSTSPTPPESNNLTSTESSNLTPPQSNNPTPALLPTRTEPFRVTPGLILTGGCVVTVLMIVGFIIFVGVSGINGIGNVTAFFQSIFNFSQPTQAVVANSQTIVTGIQPLGQLVTMSVQVAQADIFVGVAQSTANVCGFSANHVAEGAIEAGIDLTIMNEQDAIYDVDTNTYTLNLPAARLTNCSIEHIRQYDTSTTLCSVDWDEARLLAEYTALNDFRDDTLEGGVLSRAEQQARVVLTSFIEGLTGANVVINFDQNANNTLPASCQPEPPLGWSYDEAENTWTHQD
jgi:hypothetical protein